MALVGKRDGRNFGWGRQLSYAGPQALRDIFGGGHAMRKSPATSHQYLASSAVVPIETLTDGLVYNSAMN